MKIAVTTLDQYRYWRETEFQSDETEARVLQELVAKIRGERLPLPEPALRGIAFANILERPPTHYDLTRDLYVSDGFEFDPVTLTQFRLLMPEEAAKEIWMPRYHHGDNYLVGRADLMFGNVIGDVKLIAKKFNAQKYDSYEASIQWRAELLMADCPEFRYYIAQAKHRKGDDVIEVVNFQEFTFYRTPRTDDRVRQLMNDFGEFAQPYLEDAA